MKNKNKKNALESVQYLSLLIDNLLSRVTTKPIIFVQDDELEAISELAYIHCQLTEDYDC